MATQSTLAGAVLTASADTENAVSMLRHVGALERSIFLATLKPLHAGRWASLTMRVADAFPGEVSPADIAYATDLHASMLRDVA